MRKPRATLAVDLGRSECRVALWIGDAAEPRITAKGDGSVGLTAPDGASIAESAILALAEPILRAQGLAKVDAVGIGAPGALIAPDSARELAERLCRSLPAEAVALTSDAVTSHAGALAKKPGLVLAIGTGSVAIAIGPRGQFHRIDGWGPWLGDAGSGAWLGRAGLRAAVRAHDGRGPETALQSAAWKQFGSPERLALQLGQPDINPARLVASFVPALAQAAEGGDAVALDLVRDAADALAATVLAGAKVLASEGLVPAPVAILGGLSQLGPLLLDPLHATLEKRGTVALSFCPASGTSLDGARELAVDRTCIHEPWMVRAGLELPVECGQG